MNIYIYIISYPMVCEISHGPMHLGAPHGRTGIFPEMCSMDHAALRLVQISLSILKKNIYIYIVQYVLYVQFSNYIVLTIFEALRKWKLHQEIRRLCLEYLKCQQYPKIVSHVFTSA